MCPMAFFGKIDIYAVKNTSIRYLWMLEDINFKTISINIIKNPF